MAIEVGAFEAKTHLSRLLEKVRRGERVTITRRGVPVAVLVPPEEVRRDRTGRAMDELASLRERTRKGRDSIAELRRAGRRS
jgi:prevent-host-death family protein